MSGGDICESMCRGSHRFFDDPFLLEEYMNCLGMTLETRYEAVYETDLRDQRYSLPVIAWGIVKDGEWHEKINE